MNTKSYPGEEWTIQENLEMYGLEDERSHK